MTTDPELRKQVIDAMIEAADIFYGQASAALDAALDVLGKSQEDWIRASELAGGWGVANRLVVEGLLAVLRAGSE